MIRRRNGSPPSIQCYTAADRIDAERNGARDGKTPKQRRRPAGLEKARLTSELKDWVRIKVMKLLKEKPRRLSLEDVAAWVKSHVLSALKSILDGQMLVTNNSLTIPVLDLVDQILKEPHRKRRINPDGLSADDFEALIAEKRKPDEGDRQNIKRWLKALKKAKIITKTQLQEFYDRVIAFAGERHSFSVIEFQQYYDGNISYPIGIAKCGLNMIGNYLLKYGNMPPEHYREFKDIETRTTREKMKPRKR